MLLEALAEVFDPDEPKSRLQMQRLKVVLKKRNQGHPNPFRDAAIASAINKLRIKGEGYQDAVDQIAEAIGKSSEQVKRIYGNAPGMKNLSNRARKPRK
jgi:hypothetical protein